MNKKIVSLILALSVAVCSFCAFLPSVQVSALTRQELQDKIDRLDGEISQNKDKLDELKDKRESQQEYLDTLEEQIKTIKDKATQLQTQVELIDGELGELNDRLSQLNKEISIIEGDIIKAQDDIDDTEKDIAETSDLLSQRLRASYMQGEDSAIKILMGADSLASFLTRLEMMKRSSENDKKVILEFKEKAVALKEKKTALEKTKLELDGKKTDVEAKKAEVADKKSELTAKEKEYENTRTTLEKSYTEVENYVAQLDKSSAVYQTYIKQLEDEKEKADAEIDRLLSEYYATSQKTPQTTLHASNVDPGESGGSSFNSDETWAWPIGTRWCYISSKYGNRDPSISGWKFHGGIDLAAGQGRLHGAPVYATRSGRVISAVTSDSGYGIYVVIDHGDGYSSLYAHMSERYVSTGDSVTKGQMIGRVGDTGNSRGAHLHFEIRYYGEKKDPLNFVKNPN